MLADAHHLPFRNSTFQKTFFIDVIEHVENPTKTLKEIKRVTINNGKIIIGTPNALSAPKIIRSFFKNTYSPSIGHIQTYEKPELKQLFEHSGFKDFKITFSTYKNQRDKYRFVLPLFPKSLKHRQLLAIIKNE